MPMKTIEGYSKEKYTNTSVLLAGGGAKALSDFIGSLSWDSTNKKIKYTPVEGSTTDLVTLSWDNIANKPTSLPANGGNADTVDGYHASNLWRSDGGVWNPSANITLGASANGQEWSFDIRRNGYTGCYWHVWDSSRSTMLSVTPDDGKVRAPYGFVGNLEGTATSAGNADTVDGQHLITQVSDWNTDSLSIFKSSENSISNAPITDFIYGVTLRFHRSISVYHTDLVTSLYHDRLFFRRKTEDGYHTWRELIHSGNIGSQSVNYANSAGSVAWGNVTGKPSTFEPSSHNHDTLYPKKDGTGASGTWGINITGNAGRLSLTSCYNGTTNNDLWSTIKSSNSSYLGTATIYEVYNDGGPNTYGEVLDIVSVHSNHWQPQLWFDAGKGGRLRYRNKDYNDNSWGDWRTVAWTSDIPSVGNGTVTVTQAGSTIGSFTMNQSGNTLIALNDTNTNYYPIRSYTSGLQISSYSGSADCALFVPYATSAIAGVVSTAAQSFAGQKTFLNGIKVGSTRNDQSTDNTKIYFGDNKFVWIGESPQDDSLMLNCGSSSKIYFSFAGSTAVTSSNYSTYAKIYMANSGAMYASSGFYESSDERLKKVVDTIKVNLDDLAKLRKIYYLWNNTPEDGRQLGMIAQDVQKLYPELVSTDKNTGYLSLAYDKLSVIALEAIDTLYEEYKQLKERINGLEKLLHSKEIL